MARKARLGGLCYWKPAVKQEATGFYGKRTAGLAIRTYQCGPGDLSWVCSLGTLLQRSV